MATNRIFHSYHKPIGILIKSSPNQIAYIAENEYINKNSYFEVIGFQNRCPSFMIPEVLEWFFKRERIPVQCWLSELFNIESMIRLANFHHMLQYGTIPTFYLGYITKKVNKYNTMYHIAFYTDFRNIKTSGVKLEFRYDYNKKSKIFKLENVSSSFDYRATYYSTINDSMFAKIDLFNLLVHKYESRKNEPVYNKIFKELSKTMDDVRETICIPEPIRYDIFELNSEKINYPFSMENNYCNVFTDATLKNQLYFTSHLLCENIAHAVDQDIIEKLDGVIDVHSNYADNEYLKDTCFITSNDYPDFNIYYKFNQIAFTHNMYISDAENDDDQTRVLNYQFNKSASEKLIGFPFFDQLWIQTFNINHPLASVVYMNSIRELLINIVDNVMSKFVMIDNLIEKGIEPIDINEKEGKIFIKEKYKNQATTILANQIENMNDDELSDILKNSIPDEHIN